MERGGMGSASIVLVFAVLCLTIFTVIAYSFALTEQGLIEKEVLLVESFYAADAKAEQILAEIVRSEVVPSSFMGVELYTFWEFDRQRVSFVVPMTGEKELNVVLEIGHDCHEVIIWRVNNLGEWQPDLSINIWPGH